MPVELTESAKKKLPAALAAKEKRKKAGGLGNVRDRKKRMEDIMGAIKTSNRSGR